MRKRINVGLLLSNLADAFDSSIYNGAIRGAEEEDVNLIVFPGRYLKPRYNDLDRSRSDYQYNTVFSHISREHIDVLIVLMGTIGTVISEEEKRTFLRMYEGIPTLIVAENIEGYPSIGFDNRSGLRDGITELIEKKGCRAIGMVSGPLTSEDAVERLNVYREVLEAHGLEVSERRIVYGNFSEYSEEIVGKLLDDAPELDAVVFANDQMALGGYKVFRERGIVVGEDLMVMGFDDVPAAARLTPGLTTVRANAAELGRRAVAAAVQLAQGKTGEIQAVPTTLVRRGSTGSGEMQLTGELLKELREVRDPEEAITMLLRLVYGDRYEYFRLHGYEAEARELTGIFLQDMEEGDRELRLERCGYLLSVITDRIFQRGDDIRYLFRLLELLQELRSKLVRGERSAVLARFLYECLMKLGLLLAGMTERQDAEADNVQWMSNSIARDMLSYGDGSDESYGSVNDKLMRLGYSAAYLYALDAPYINIDAEAWHDFNVPSRVLLKSYLDETGAVVCVPRAEQELRADEMYDNRFMSEERRYVLIVNIIFINEEQLGFFVAEVPGGATKHLPAILAQLSAAMKIIYMMDTQREIRRQLESSNEFLETISKVDELTGIYNRRGFRETAAHQVHNPIYQGRKAILVFADLDNLKVINDRLGHDEGDFALRAVAQILKESMRTSDIVARIGGDEFVALAVVNDATEGAQLKARIKSVMESFNAACEKPYYVGVSVGYAEFVCGREVDLELYMGQADEKLYEDKKRKRVEVMKAAESSAAGAFRTE